MQPKILVATWVHNGEKTLKRAIESVLAQNYSNFIYYIVDNVSTDGTAGIAQDYAVRDTRVRYLQRPENSYDLNLFTWVFDAVADDYDYFVNLDADDEYTPAFLQRMLHFMLANDLDVGSCGSVFICAETGQCCGRRTLAQNLLLTQPDCFANIGYYLAYIRTIWGKMYKKPLINKTNTDMLKAHPHADMAYGSDALFNFLLLQGVSRFGVLAETLHRYYQDAASMTGQLTPKRLEADLVINHALRGFLAAKCGGISRDHERFLMADYAGAIRSTLALIERKLR